MLKTPIDTSVSLPPLRRSDHNIVQLIPIYRPLVQREPTVTRTMKEWSDDAVEKLEGSLDCTDWDVFVESSSNINVTQWANWVSVRIYWFLCRVYNTTENCKNAPHNKPWITKRIKGIINRKKLAFLKNDKEEYRSVQKELQEEIRKEKEQYKNKIESHFTYNNVRRVWSGMKLMSIYM